MGAFVPAVIKGVVAFFASTGAVAVIVKTVLINVALGAVSKALAKKPRQDTSVPSVSVTVRGSTEYRRLIFGTRKVAGVFVYYGTSGTSSTYLWYVIVLSGHQVNDIKDVWLDTVKIDDANINASTGAVTQGNYTGNLNIWRYTGTDGQTVQSDLDTDFSVWTSTHRLRGCAYLVVRMNRSETAFPTGAPQSISALVDGALLYDPRLDSTNGGSGSHRYTDPSTWEFSRNPVLILRWYLTGGSVINDLTSPLVRYGLKEPASRIDDAYFIAAANVCDEVLTGANETPDGDQSRYLCDLEVTCGETRRAIIEAILATMAGRLVNVHGKWRAYAGDYETPVHTITQDDLYGDIEIQDTTPHTERYNAVAAVFPDSGNDYVDRTTIFRTDSAYETQDGGERLPLEIDLRGVTNQYQAQRLAEIKLRQSRMMRVVKIVGALNLLKVALHENMSFSHARYGWSSRVFRCVERQFEYQEDAGRVTLTLQQEASTVYADLLTADYTTGTSDTDEFQTETPEAPTALTATAMRDGVMLAWTIGSFWQLHGIVEIWRYSAISPFGSATKIWEGRGSNVFIPQNSLTTQYYWATIRTINGQRSSNYPSGNGVAGAPSSVTQWVARGNCVAGGTSARKVGGSSAWDSDVYSIDSYQTCHVQFKPSETNANVMVGLNQDPSADSSYTSIDHAWHCENDGTCGIRENGGSEIVDAGAYTVESVFAISYDGTDVVYTKDGAVIRTVANSGKTFFADSSFYAPDCSVNSLFFGPGPTLDKIATAQIDTDAVGEQFYSFEAGPVTRDLSSGGIASGPSPLHYFEFTASSDGIVWASLDCVMSRVNAGSASLGILANGVIAGESVDITPTAASTDTIISRTVAAAVSAGDTVRVRIHPKTTLTSSSVTASGIEMNVRFYKR